MKQPVKTINSAFSKNLEKISVTTPVKLPVKKTITLKLPVKNG